VYERSDYALVELRELLDDLFFVRHLAQRVYVDVPADALRVDDDDRALRAAQLLVEDAIRLGHLAVRPVIGAERVFDATERFGPRLQRVDGITEDAHDLGLSPGEALLERVQRGSFAVSGIRKREGEER